MESGAYSKASIFKDQCDRDLFDRLGKVVKDRVLDTNRPLIGILSQPVADDKREIFDYEEYILGINYEFLTLGNS